MKKNTSFLFYMLIPLFLFCNVNLYALDLKNSTKSSSQTAKVSRVKLLTAPKSMKGGTKGLVYKAAMIKKDPRLSQAYQDWVLHLHPTDSDIRAGIWFWTLVQNRRHLMIDGNAHCPIKARSFQVCYVATKVDFTTILYKDGRATVVRATTKRPKHLKYYISQEGPHKKDASGSGYKSAGKRSSDEYAKEQFKTWIGVALAALSNTTANDNSSNDGDETTSDAVTSDYHLSDDVVALSPGDMYISPDGAVIINNGQDTTDVTIENDRLSRIGGDLGNVTVLDAITGDLPKEIQSELDKLRGVGGIVDRGRLTGAIERFIQQDENDHSQEPPGHVQSENVQSTAVGGAGNLVRVIYVPVFGDITDKPSREAWNRHDSDNSRRAPNEASDVARSRQEEAARRDASGSGQSADGSGNGRGAGNSILDALGLAWDAAAGAVGGVAKTVGGFIGAMAKQVWNFLTQHYDRSYQQNDDGDDDEGSVEVMDDGGGGDTGDADSSDQNSQQQTQTSNTETDEEGTPITDYGDGNTEYAGPGPEDQPESDTVVVRCSTEQCEQRGVSRCREHPDDPYCSSEQYRNSWGSNSTDVLERYCMAAICDDTGGCICAGDSGGWVNAGALSLAKKPSIKIHTDSCDRIQCPAENSGCCEKSSYMDMIALQRRVKFRLCNYFIGDNATCVGVVGRDAYCRENPNEVSCKARNTRPRKKLVVPMPPPRSMTEFNNPLLKN